MIIWHKKNKEKEKYRVQFTFALHNYIMNIFRQMRYFYKKKKNEIQTNWIENPFKTVI